MRSDPAAHYSLNTTLADYPQVSLERLIRFHYFTCSYGGGHHRVARACSRPSEMVRYRFVTTVALESPTRPLRRARRDRSLQREHGDLRAHIESHGQVGPHAAIDVQPATASQRELAARIPLVLHREDGRREKRRLALPAVRMPGQHPSGERAPPREIHRIGIVAEHQLRRGRVHARKRAYGIEHPGPQITHP
ncbi:MAG: hypothetical protein ACK55I_23820, partial [bacterium]